MMNMCWSIKYLPGFLSAFLFVLISCNGDFKNNIPEIELPAEQQAVYFIFDDTFNQSEKTKLKEWISYTSDCAQRVLGQFPFDLYYHFHREDSSDRAVVFGHTSRTDSINEAHFYVNPTYSPEALREDWIAPHEISHLAIPKLGKSHRWFFEGFATYMSREVMIEMNVFTREEVDSINHARISMAAGNFTSSSTISFITDSLIANHHQYAPVYWIGANFFLKADQLLAEEGKMSLADILKEFQVCCHRPVMSIHEIIEAFDKICATNCISNLFVLYTESPVNTLLLDYE